MSFHLTNPFQPGAELVENQSLFRLGEFGAGGFF